MSSASPAHATMHRPTSSLRSHRTTVMVLLMSISVARRREAPGNPKIDAYGMSPLASVSRLNRVSSLLVFCAATVCLGCSDDDAVTDPDSEEGSSVEPLVPLITGHRSTFRFVALDSSM